MDLEQYNQEILDTVYEPMLEYFRDFEEDEDPGYTEEAIGECRRLLEDYGKALAELEDPSEEEILSQVEQVVLALNDLNEETDYAMIETDEREAICALIQGAALDTGLPETDDDVTEPWREW